MQASQNALATRRNRGEFLGEFSWVEFDPIGVRELKGIQIFGDGLLNLIEDVIRYKQIQQWLIMDFFIII